MIRLLFIVPYPELENVVSLVLSNHTDRERIIADIKAMTVEETPDVPVGEYDAIIARGYTAQKTIAAYSEIPTISLQVSGYDIFRAISECCEKYHPKKIAVIGFDKQFWEAKDICKLFDVEAMVFSPVPHENLQSTVEKVINAGCDVIIGGYSANILAAQKGVPSIVIRTGEDAIQRATDEAIQIVDQIRQERIVAQTYKMVIYSAQEGILFVNSDGIIQVRNHMVRKFHGNISLLNRPLKNTLPYLYNGFHKTFSSGIEQIGKVLTIPGTKMTVSVSFVPVVANKKISGVVINIADITQIQDLESQIRRKLSERGLKAKYTFDDIIHQSPVLEKTITTAKRYSKSDSNVIIAGETGTGKELFAQSIHNSSNRKNGPFVAINCAALAENLLESELFGYVEGAFTGTKKGGKTGLFEQAHGGTLFLDEIGEISMSTQSKLLRVLQERQVRRIGDDKVIDVNVRIISATNRSIQRMCDQGKFRKDLMYRLDVLRLYLPPLRERGTDIEILFKYLLNLQMQKINEPPPSIEENALEVLYNYPFSGNIRELRNIVERAVALRTNEYIARKDLEAALYPHDMHESQPYTEPQNEKIVAFNEKDSIISALQQCGGNKTLAAKKLHMDRTTLWRKMQKHQIYCEK